MSGWIETDPASEWFSDAGTFTGSAHSVSGDSADDDPAEAVRKVAEEVTRRELPRKQPRRMGFL